MVEYDAQVPHYAFIGRWCPLHKGHISIIKKKLEEKKRPVLILVRDTSFDQYNAAFRAKMVRCWLDTEGIAGKVVIIPDIEGVYYGRGVGYKIEMVDVDEVTKGISATEIRKRIGDGDSSWMELVAPGIADFLRKEWKEV